MIRVDGVDKHFQAGRERVAALRNIGFDVQSHRFFTLLGPSGCGKSTLLRCVAGLETPDTGEITIGGRCVFSSSRRINLSPDRRCIGMVFQSYAIWPHMTVCQNVAFPLEVKRAKDVRKRAMDALELVGLAAMADRYASRLSGGQQQRVAFARAIVAEPEVLLLDEPLSNLDAALREQMCAELSKLHDRVRRTTLYVTHDQEEALSLSDEIAVMRDGRFVEVGTPEALWNRPRTVFAAQFLGGANIIPGEARAQAGGAAVHTAFGVVHTGCSASGPIAIFVRPEHVAIVDAGSGPNRFAARIVSQRFLGELRHLELALGSGQVLDCRIRATVVLPDGEITAYVDPEHVQVLQLDAS